MLYNAITSHLNDALFGLDLLLIPNLFLILVNIVIFNKKGLSIQTIIINIMSTL